MEIYTTFLTPWWPPSPTPLRPPGDRTVPIYARGATSLIIRFSICFGPSAGFSDFLTLGYRRSSESSHGSVICRCTLMHTWASSDTQWVWGQMDLGVVIGSRENDINDLQVVEYHRIRSSLAWVNHIFRLFASRYLTWPLLLGYQSAWSPTPQPAPSVRVMYVIYCNFLTLCF